MTTPANLANHFPADDMQMVCSLGFHRNTVLYSLFLGLELEHGLCPCLCLKVKWSVYSTDRNLGTCSGP